MFRELTPASPAGADDKVTNLTQSEMKAALKSAIKEWLDERFAEFGRWSLGAVLAAALAALITLILHMNGWQKVSH